LVIPVIGNGPVVTRTAPRKRHAVRVERARAFFANPSVCEARKRHAVRVERARAFFANPSVCEACEPVRMRSLRVGPLFCAQLRHDRLAPLSAIFREPSPDALFAKLRKLPKLARVLGRTTWQRLFNGRPKRPIPVIVGYAPDADPREPASSRITDQRARCTGPRQNAQLTRRPPSGSRRRIRSGSPRAYG
jgi:hypothetical protein